MSCDRTAEDNLDDYYTVHHGVVEIEAGLCMAFFVAFFRGE